MARRAADPATVAFLRERLADGAEHDLRALERDAMRDVPDDRVGLLRAGLELGVTMTAGAGGRTWRLPK